MKPTKLSNKQLMHAHGVACRELGLDSDKARTLKREMDRRAHSRRVHAEQHPPRAK